MVDIVYPVEMDKQQIGIVPQSRHCRFVNIFIGKAVSVGQIQLRLNVGGHQSAVALYVSGA